jgi:hypothetical protein
MAFYVRDADPIADEQAIHELASRYLEAHSPRRFSWLYKQNPFGSARVWLAFERETDMPVGMAAMFPRKTYVNGNKVSAAVLGDFCISERFRSLGPAVQLQKACLSPVKSGEIAFCYDYPSSGMLSIYKYLGLVPCERSLRFVKLLKVGATIGGRATHGLAKPVLDLTSLLLKFREPKPPASDKNDYKLENEPFSSEYQALADKVGSSQGDCTARTATYLNWRFRQHPSEQYELLAAYRGGELQGYCVFKVSGDHAQLTDMLSVPQADTMTGLLFHLLRILRLRGASTVNLSAVAGDPRVPLLKKFGFWARESVPVIRYSAGRDDLGRRLLLMQGDRES